MISLPTTGADGVGPQAARRLVEEGHDVWIGVPGSTAAGPNAHRGAQAAR